LLAILAILILSCSTDDNSELPIPSSSSGKGNCGGNEYNLETHLCDSRDGKIYKFKKIGVQTWMAENLNYPATGSKCYDDNETNCDRYGRLYNWTTAMNIASTYSSSLYLGSWKHKGRCPDGWHIPSDTEWETLMDFADGGAIAGRKLKATSDWNSNGNGEDAYGFSALPGGYRNNNGSADVGSFGGWWKNWGRSLLVVPVRRVTISFTTDVWIITATKLNTVS